MDQQDTNIDATNTKEPTYDCRACGKIFLGHRNSGDKEFQQHMKIHAREKPFKCRHCNKGYASAHMLAIHVVVHTGEKPYQCNQCGKAYGQKSNLTKHINKNTKHRLSGRGLLRELNQLLSFSSHLVVQNGRLI